MPSERPSIDPISTQQPSSRDSPAAHSRPEIATKSLPARIAPGLPSPPLSPLQFHNHGHHGTGKRSSMLSFPLAASQPMVSLVTESRPSTTVSLIGQSTPRSTPIEHETGPCFAGGYRPDEEEEVDSTVPMLPSQLRRRHESMRRHRSLTVQSPSASSAESTAVDFSRNHIHHNNNNNNNHDNQSDHSNRFLVHSRSPHTNNLMELTPSFNQRILANQGFSSAIVPVSHSSNVIAVSTTTTPEMPTRDWVKMQCKIQALETEVSHVSRTNSLLNQELDKVTAHLSRLLNSETDEQQGEGERGIGAGPVESWRREYEFLVQQVDLMHRQLQLAQSEQHARARFGMEVVSARSEDRSEMTQQLYSEVKDLTASLKMWQSAFQQADEKYRRKCDGERTLKETLRDRETQLGTLVDKLSGCESEFRKSISNYDEMMRLSDKVKVLESTQINQTNNTKTPLLALESPQAVSSTGSPSTSTLTTSDNDNSSEMPGSFPEVVKGQTRRRSNTLPSSMASTATVEQVSVSILSWATLLATYMLS